MTARPNTAAQPADFEFAALAEARNYRRALIRDFSPHLRGHVLEVGAGIGQITSELRQIPDVTRLVSIEPDRRFCARLRESFPDHAVIEGTIADLPNENSWNALISINVLEHIEADEQELARYHDALAGGNGILCLFVPARPEIYAPIDRDFGHYRRYSRKEIRQKLMRAGFEELQLRYYNSVGYFAWWLTFCLLRKRAFNVRAVRFFDRVIFPIVHGFESRVCRPPIGQSLLVTARANGTSNNR